MSPSRVTRNAARSVSSMPGKTELEVMRDHALERDHQPAVADRDETRQRLRHLHAGKALLAGIRVAHGDAEREREPRDVGERLAGPDGERREDGVDLPHEVRLERPVLALVQVLDGPHDDPLGGKSRHELVAPELRLRARQLEHALTHLGERLPRRAPVGRADVDARDHLVEQAGHANHEELVEVRREDRAELDALEQRLAGVGGEVEDALVQVQPRQLPVQEGLVGCLCDRAGRCCQGVPSSPKRGECGVSIR